MALSFRKQYIADEKYESAGVFDVNNDGVLDIVSGTYWYEGPDSRRGITGTDFPDGEYFDDFSTIAMDVNGDGYLDVITGGWSHGVLRWEEIRARRAGNGRCTTSRSAPTSRPHRDVGCGRRWRDGDRSQYPGGPLVVYKLTGPGQFAAHKIYDERQGHGLGFGDITGNGRGDFVFNNGWLEAPEHPYQGK